MVPLYLKYISAETYGVWLATGNVLFWLGVLDPGFSQVIVQRISLYYGADNLSKVGQYIYWGIIIGLLISLVVALLGIFFYINFADWLKVNDLEDLSELRNAFLLSLIGTCLLMFSYSIASINQGLQSSLGIGIVFFIANIGSIILTIYFLINGLGIVTLGLAILFRGIIYLLGNFCYLFYRLFDEKIKIFYSRETLKDFASLISFNFLGKIGATISTQVNSFFIIRMLGAQQVVNLKFTQSAPELSKLFLVRPALAIMPSLVHLIGEGDTIKANIILKRLLFFTVWGLGLALTGFVIFNQTFVTLWVGENFYGGRTLNILICIWITITIITEVLNFIVYSLGDIKKSNLIIFSQSVLFIILIVPFIKNYGLSGVIVASIISNICFSVWYFPFSFLKLTKFSILEINPIIIEILKILFISISMIYLFENMTITNWLIFSKEVLLVSFLYFLCLIFCSNNFKKEFFLFFKIKSKYL